MGFFRHLWDSSGFVSELGEIFQDSLGFLKDFLWFFGHFWDS